MAQAADDLVVQTTRFFVCCMSHPNLYIACGTSTGPSENGNLLWMPYKFRETFRKYHRGFQQIKDKSIVVQPDATRRQLFGRAYEELVLGSTKATTDKYAGLKFSILPCERALVQAG